MEENREQKKMSGPLIYAVVGVAVLIVAVAGSAYAYYAEIAEAVEPDAFMEIASAMLSSNSLSFFCSNC